MRSRSGVLLGCWLALMLGALTTGADTLPISYLRLQPKADYLYLEFTFNAFEVSFFSELDDNHDGELDAAELKAHGQVLADRVVAALKVSAGDQLLAPETVGLDPDMRGHHVLLRAHYKVDARHVPLTLESGLNGITSSSHLIQVTYAPGGQQQLGQLDTQTRKLTFQPFVPAPKLIKVVKVRRIAFGAVALLAVLLLVVVVGMMLLLLRRPPRRR